jgi:hypothetical protein
MNDNNITIYAQFLQKCLQKGAGMPYAQASKISENYRALAKTNRAILLVGAEAFDACAETNDYDKALTLVSDSLTRIQNEAKASTDCSSILTPGAKAIFDALKNKKFAGRDDDTRKWKGLTELDVEFPTDNRLRINLIERKEVFTAIASQNELGLELSVKY